MITIRKERERKKKWGKIEKSLKLKHFQDINVNGGNHWRCPEMISTKKDLKDMPKVEIKKLKQRMKQVQKKIDDKKCCKEKENRKIKVCRKT